MATITKTTNREVERLRRSALVAQGPNEEEQSGGGWPFNVFMDLMAGGVDPEDPTKISFSLRRRMRRDHMLAMALHFITMPILRAPWYFECEDARVAAFADNLIRPIYGRLVLTIMRFLWAGYSPARKDFEVINPNWTYRDEQRNIKQVWTSDSVGAMVYKNIIPLKPEICRPDFVGGQFNGIKWDKRFGDGFFLINGEKKKKIDLFHSIWATHGREDEDNNIYGFPRIAHAAPIHHMYWYIWSLLGRAFENNADPGPIVRYPKDEPFTLSSDGTTVKNVDTALKLGRRRRSGSTVALPSEPYTDYQDRPSSKDKWGFEYPESKTDFEALIKWVGFLEAAKLRAMWLPEQGVIEGEGGSSSRNVAEEFGNQRDASQIGLMATIDWIIEYIMVKPALAINIPSFEGTLRKRTMGTGQQDEEVIRQFFQLMGQEDWKTFGVDARRLAASRGLPMLGDQEFQNELERREAEQAAQIESGQPPAVTPTQGRRALVTQTGFNEFEYQQLGSVVSGNFDDNFVANLPRTMHFEDSSVVAVSRQLRESARVYYKNCYEDFARFVSLRRRLDFDEQLDEEEQAKRLADRIVSSWRPRLERAIKFSQQARLALGKVFTRASSLHLKDLGSSTRLDSKDSVAARWLEQRGAELVADITNTLRQDLREFMARELREGATPKELAKRIREEFSDWPDWKADRLARTETTGAYNFATLSAGKSAGIKNVQILDGNDDAPCRNRNGKIVKIADAFKEALAHPNCTLGFRLLAGDQLEVRRELMEAGVSARFDEESHTILLSPDLTREQETQYMLAVGETLAA